MKKYKPLSDTLIDLVLIFANTYAKEKYPLGGKTYKEFDVEVMWRAFNSIKIIADGVKNDKKN
uniref:Uncharacterized protein n=1 Tax=viral metagenome TaxID=1070528 RepID=A0A6M3LA00_9ZZZZ